MRDVIILGSGVTGCSIAYSLLKEQRRLSVGILEARTICSGATGRNGGRINCTAIQDYSRYRKLFGDEAAVKIVRFELAHLGAIEKIVKELKLERISELREVEAIATAFEERDLSALRDMLRSFEYAFPDMKGWWKLVEGKPFQETYGVKHGIGALVGKAGACWPYRLFTNIYAHLLAENAQRFSIDANTPAISIKREMGSEFPYIIQTSRGLIRAKHVIHCTEGHTTYLLPKLRGILVPRRGQMTVQNPGSGFGDHTTRSWSFMIKKGLDYATQNVHSKELFIGGGDVDGKSDVLGISSDAEHDVSALSHLGGILPAAFGIEQWGCELPGKRRMQATWTGIMCNSLDQVPMVGMLPQQLLDRRAGDFNSAEWLCAGYGGYGMVNAFLSGKAVAQILGGGGIPSWFPDQFVLTSDRADRLLAKLRLFSGRELEHLKALL